MVETDTSMFGIRWAIRTNKRVTRDFQIFINKRIIRMKICFTGTYNIKFVTRIIWQIVRTPKKSGIPPKKFPLSLDKSILENQRTGTLLSETSRQKPFSKVNNLNINKILKLTYEITVNLFKNDLLGARKNKAETKTEDNVKELFILTPKKSLFNGLELIKNIKSNEN